MVMSSIQFKKVAGVKFDLPESVKKGEGLRVSIQFDDGYELLIPKKYIDYFSFTVDDDCYGASKEICPACGAKPSESGKCLCSSEKETVSSKKGPLVYAS